MTNKVVVQKVVGEISICCEASSDRRDISMQDLLNIANMGVGNKDTVTGREGVNLTVTMSGPDAPAAPLFTPVEGCPHSISIATSDDEIEKFNDELEYRTGEMFSSALNWYLCKASNYAGAPMSDRMLADMSAREIAKGWAHVQMLQEKIVHMEKNHLEGVELINAYKAQINELQQLMGKRADEYCNNIRSMERELKGKTDANIELEHKIKRMKDYAVRLNSIY